jgi:uncharacterized protein (DUF1697 family)
MTQYVAFPRGINAGHSMKMAELRAVFEALGFEQVRTVLASGNVLFETAKRAETALTKQIETGLTETFGARIPVVLRTRAELERLVKANPFEKAPAGPKTRPYVTFLKTKPGRRELPKGKGYEVLGIYDRTVCSVVDLTGATSPDLMRVLDKTFGDEVTTRGWGTVEKVVRAAAQP